MTRSESTERIREWARDEGFDPVGVAKLAPAATVAAYERWLDRGDQASMAWMERNRALRADPRGLLAGAQSALVVGLRYAPHPEADGDPGSIWNRVARYARGRDYHAIVRERLFRVAEQIERSHPGAATRVCVDTAPLLERELAARAGIGAVGKNTNLIHPELGSWFLLGELLTTLDLVPDEPYADLCGECTRCLDACPTGALPAPYRLDARRCLSYWTIEHRGEIPAELRGHLVERLFGCDICQEVCPWNRDPEPVLDPELAPSRSARSLDLEGLLGLSQERYRALFRDSAMSRARRAGLRRNAAYAADGGGDRGLHAALETAVGDEAPEVAAAARWSLARGEARD